MYRSIERQRGMGWFGLTLVFGAIAFAALLVMKVGPLYSNQFVVVKAVQGVADDPGMEGAGPAEIRNALQKRWDVDYIDQIEAKDIKLVRTKSGPVLRYDYEARTNLFYNVYVIVHFKGEHKMRAAVAGLADS